MTVRAHKPEFNFREKLKELERPIGLKGNELMRAETAQDARDLVSAGRKNLVINGDMRIAQRGTSFTTAASGDYAADRWMYERSSNAVVTISQRNVWNNGPYWAHSIKVETTTARSSTANTNFQQFLYKIEANDFGRFRFGTAQAKPFTFSFWVKSNKTGDFPASFQNSNGTRVFPIKYTINQADTWEKKVIVVPGDKNGSWNLYTNAIGIRFTLMWSMGSNFTDGTEGAWAATTGYADLTTCAGDQMDVVGATLEFAHVQLEEGKNATDFEHRSYGEEFALCQRYYQKNIQTSGQYTAIFTGSNYSSNTVYGAYHLQTPMRTSPTSMGYSNLNHFSIINTNGSTNPNPTALGIDNGSGTQTLRLYATATGLTAGQGAFVQMNNTSAYIDFSAEL